MLRNGLPRTPSALKQRALLALLLLSANAPVPTHRLIEGLWGSRPPQAAAATLQMYVSGLRRALDPEHGAAHRDPRHHPVLRTEANGYRMRVAPGELDLDRFRTLTADGRRHLAEGRCRQAGEALRQALALWRGHPFADLEHSGRLGSSAVRLEEERLSALGDSIDVVLCRGRSHEISDVIGELHELCAAHPLRESLHEQLIRALCRVGRRAEALTVYARVRGMMIAELGIEPGPGLRAAQLVALEAREPYGTGHLHCR
ncbi:AfsR/SARP family transcriptional regulator [Streptomyces sp. NBC_00448]|uniref:AfsR/SARP family transcriptional regulator n=1 Tax=Streptomyces sp. NBC_00448 TaxID=2903652 RepID=UPI002E23B5C9